VSELRPAAYVMLGMLRVGSRSGYEIRKSAELSLRFFWAVSPRQIYDELRVLEERGLVRGSDDPKGSMKRRTFALTATGERALAGWVAEPELGLFEWRDLGLLKLFFADVLTPAERRALIARMRARAAEVQQKFETTILPAAARTGERHGNDMPELVARFGADFWDWAADWLERAEAGVR
jgi:DNA-binding PadR family transcriptional regulator